jgi:hypothetical protein
VVYESQSASSRNLLELLVDAGSAWLYHAIVNEEGVSVVAAR